MESVANKCIFLFPIHTPTGTATTTLPYKITAKKFITITVLKGDACNFLSKGGCPVKMGDVVTYQDTIHISKRYPSVRIANFKNFLV